MKSGKPMSPVKKHSSLGHLYFIYDQDHRRAVVDEPDKYVRPISGYIEVIIGDSHGNAHEGMRERRTVAGRFDASYINVDTCLVEGVKLRDVMDPCSAETAVIHETLFDPHKDELRKEVKELLGDVPFRNILVINRVEILPAYRGMRLGLAAIWNIIQRHSSGCGIVALNAFPRQFRAGGWSGRLSDLEESDWDKKMGYDPYSYTVEFASEKLIFHLMKLGFECIGNSRVMALSTSMKNPLPQAIHRWVLR